LQWHNDASGVLRYGVDENKTTRTATVLAPFALDGAPDEDAGARAMVRDCV
jgi:hypothetical protein